MRKNIMMIDSDINQVSVFKQYVFSCKDINISNIYLNYDDEAIMGIINNSYDILVINYDLNIDYTINILKYYKDNNIHKKVMLITDKEKEEVKFLKSIYNIECFIMTNFTEEMLNSIFLNIYGMYEDMENDSIIIHTSKVLHELGIPSSIKGYTFIREAIALIYANDEMVISVTKDIYPLIAKNHNTMATRVARAIRHAIEVAWNRGDIDAIAKYFGNSINIDKSRPTNSEFMFTIADYLKITS